MIRFEEALAIVEAKAKSANLALASSPAQLDRSSGFILAEDIFADRDYPPFHRAARDGFAVRSSDLEKVPATLEMIGEIAAGQAFDPTVGAGQCVRIMTGAALPEGANAVVMVEETRQNGSRVEMGRAVTPFENVVRRASEAREGARVLARGKRIAASEIALLASLGKSRVQVYEKPKVALVATGDELVSLDATPGAFQIRNSNSPLVAACIERAGGVPLDLGIARDQKEMLRAKIEEGLRALLLVLSGGVSMGAYDLVKAALTDLGAEFFFHGVAIRPGKPLLFGRLRETFFFGLPGNPVSSFVTFELFVRPMIRSLSGAAFERPIFYHVRLGSHITHKVGLTSFIPARIGWENGSPTAHPVHWQGSGDLAGLVAADGFVVARDDQGDLSAGDWVGVLPE